MNRDQWNDLLALGDPAAVPDDVHVDEVSGPDRTLVYGYTVDRDTFHCYKAAGALHVLIYRGATREVLGYTSGARLPWAAVLPNKRAYPEDSDHAFALLARAHGHRVPFTTWGGAGAKDGPFRGLLADGTTPQMVAPVSQPGCG